MEARSHGCLGMSRMRTPRSVARSRTAAGSSLRQVTSVVSAAREDLVSRVGERRRQRRGEPGRARVHRVPAGGGEHVVRRERRGHPLGAQRRRVVAAGVGLQTRGEALVRRVEVQVDRPALDDALLPRRIDPQHPRADRPAHPLLPRPRVERAAELAHLDGHRADALRAVEQHRDVEVGQRGGRGSPRSPSARASRRRAASPGPPPRRPARTAPRGPRRRARRSRRRAGPRSPGARPRR